MLAEAFGPNSISVQDDALSWEHAIAETIQLLEQAGQVKASYLDEVLAANAKHGPYFVIAPHIAIAHAAPSSSVIATGFSLIKLQSGTHSGSANDPVKLLFGFCAKDPSSHLELLSEFAAVMSRSEMVNLLLNANNSGDLRKLLLD